METVAVSTSIPNANALYSHGFDVDGDGITDLVYPSGTTWKVSFGGVNGFTPEMDTGIVSTGYQYARPLDFNADGKGDLLVPYANSKWHLMRATGDRTNPFDLPFDTGVTDISKTANPLVADINGDGLPDLVHGHDEYWYASMGSSTGLGADSSMGIPLLQAREVSGITYYWYHKPNYARIGDIDGDGLTDVITPYLRLCLILLRVFITVTLTGSMLLKPVQVRREGICFPPRRVTRNLRIFFTTTWPAQVTACFRHT